MQVRNLTERRTEFSVKCDAPFGVSPAGGFIDGNGSVQLVASFTPPESRNYEANLTLTCGAGETPLTMVLSGGASSADVFLDTSLSSLGATYITLTSQNKVMLHNRGDVPVKFSWKVRWWPWRSRGVCQHILLGLSWFRAHAVVKRP